MDLQAEETIRQIKKGLLRWYDFKTSSHVLYIGKPEEELAEELAERLSEVKCGDVDQTIQENWQQEYTGYFDYIVSVTDLEKKGRTGKNTRTLEEPAKAGRPHAPWHE
ncbi:MAG: hypothetical protein LUK37_15120 [Clostridia bacterium]|nr:hypothetical protein [Clostridia bacterium]